MNTGRITKINADDRIYSQSAYGIHYEKLKYHSLHHAVHDLRISQIQLILKLHPDLINYRTELGLTPLMIASGLPESGTKDKIIKILTKAKKLHPYETDHCNRSALFYLVNFSNVYQINEFLEVTRFNYFDEADFDGYTVLHYAVVRENLEVLDCVVNLFQRYCININITNSLNYSPLLLACRLKRLKSAALMLKMGATGFNLRDNEHFRNCRDWIECHEDNEKNVANADHFYFNHFLLKSPNSFGNLMNIGIQRISARHIDCFSMSERSQTCISINSSRDGYPLTERVDSSDQIKSCGNKYSKSDTVKQLEDMSIADIREFIIDTLKGGHRKLNRPKRVSIVLGDRIYNPRKSIDSSGSTNVLPYCRQSSATIAHQWLNRLTIDYI